MANKTIGMNELKMLLQLKERGLSVLAISVKLGIDRRTVKKYLHKIESLKKPVDELLKLEDHELAGLILANDNINKPDQERLERLKSRYPAIKVELKDVGATRLTCWENYRNEDPDPYRYSQFCEHLIRFGLADKATMHFGHEPGNYLQVDFAGKQPSYIDRETGATISCPVLVCTLPYSNYPYVEALHNARQGSLFPALSRCLEYLGGVPKNIISDNMRQHIAKNNRYEFSFAEQVNQWALHYRTNLEAARVRKPKDKPSVERKVRGGLQKNPVGP